MIKPRPKRYSARRYGLVPTHIDQDALLVIRQLQKAGFDAYIVGGGVRDVLLGLKPKDFDIATNATPEQVKKTIRNCRLIGKRFRLAHVFFGRHIIEVATFRGGHEQATSQQEAAHREGLIMRDNVYGTIEEDAVRRDFTINALFYDPTSEKILDFVGGMKDLKKQQIHLIGEPNIRYREDPVRMLRALRIANKLSFHIEKQTLATIMAMADHLQRVSSARLFEEYQKLFLHGHAVKNCATLRKMRCFEQLFPLTAACFGETLHDRLVQCALKNTDKRIEAGKSINPGFLLSVFLWQPVLVEAKKIRQRERVSMQQAMDMAGAAILQQQVRFVSMPRRFHQVMREIWTLQAPLEQRKPRIVKKLLEHPRFRAAYDFLVMRAEVGEVDSQLANWWTEQQI